MRFPRSPKFQNCDPPGNSLCVLLSEFEDITYLRVTSPTYYIFGFSFLVSKTCPRNAKNTFQVIFNVIATNISTLIEANYMQLRWCRDIHHSCCSPSLTLNLNTCLRYDIVLPPTPPRAGRKQIHDNFLSTTSPVETTGVHAHCCCCCLLDIESCSVEYFRATYPMKKVHLDTKKTKEKDSNRVFSALPIRLFRARKQAYSKPIRQSRTSNFERNRSFRNGQHTFWVCA